MPNIVFNRLVVSGPPADLAALVARLRGRDHDDGRERVLDFRSHVPVPADLDLRSGIRPGDRHGLPPAHWWAVEHWGTKWNAMLPTLEGDPASGRVSYAFETAYSPPDSWLFVTSAAHPALTFDHEFAEELDQAAGRARVRAGELERFEHLDAEDLDWVEVEELE